MAISLVLRRTPSALIDNTDTGVTTESVNSCDEQFMDWLEQGNSLEIDPKWESARFLLRATEEHSLTHTGVDSLCDSVQWFVETVCFQIAERVEAGLPPTTDAAVKEQLLSACRPGDLFSGLKSRYMREKYYEEKFNYVVRVRLFAFQACMPYTSKAVYVHIDTYSCPSGSRMGMDSSRRRKEVSRNKTPWLCCGSLHRIAGEIVNACIC